MFKDFFKRLTLKRKKQKAPKTASKNNDSGKAKVRVQKTLELPTSQLKLGMYVRSLDVPWEQTPFLFQGFHIETDNQIKALRQAAQMATVDLEKTTIDMTTTVKKDKKKKYVAVGGNMAHSPELIKKQLSHAEALHTQAINAFNSILKDVQLGSHISQADTETTINSFSDNLTDSSDALMWMLQIRDKDNLTAQHSVSVCVISMMMGRALNLHPEQVKELGVAALMHDVGKTKVPSVLLDPKLKYNQKAFLAMAKHTRYGEQVLTQQGHFSPEVACVALHHHERWDGKGYPGRLAGEDIPLYARLVSVAEAYDTMTSPKSYRASISAGEALKKIYDARGTQFDPNMVELFIECMGVYPPGTLLEMRNGEVGIVLSVNPADKLQPRILLVLDETKLPRIPRVIDIKRGDRDASGQSYRIRNLLPVNAYSIDVGDFLSPEVLFEAA